MGPTAMDVLESARALSPAERAEIAEQLVLTLRADDADRRIALRAAIDDAARSIDAGQGDRITADGAREYLRELGRETARLADPRA